MKEEKNISGLKAKNPIATKGLDTVIAGVIALIFFLCPLFFTGLAAQGIGFEKMMIFYFLILIGLVAWVTKGVIGGELNLKRTPLDLPILAILITFGVSTILSVSSKDSLVGSYGNVSKSYVAIIIFALFYYLVVNNLNAKRIRIIFWSLISSVSLMSIYCLLQLSGRFVLPMSFTRVIEFNPTGTLSGLSMFLVIMLPLLIVAATQTKEILLISNNKIVAVVKGLMILVIAATLRVLSILSGFTFWPIAIVSTIIILMFMLSKIVKVTSNNLIVPLLSFLMIIIFLVLGNNLGSEKLSAEVSLSRSASWNIAKNTLKQDPFFGSGPSTFYYDFSKFRSPEFNATPLWNVKFDSASGIIFEILATAGALGALSVIALALVALSLSFLTLIKNNNKEIDSILLGTFASFVSASLFAVLFTQSNSLILTIVLISVFATSAALVMYPEEFKKLRLSFRASANYALALAAVFLGVSAGVVVLLTMGIKMYMADCYAQSALQLSDTQARVEKLNKSISLAPYQDNYYLMLANNYMSLANEAAIANKDSAEVGSYLSLAIEQGKNALAITEKKSQNNESLALIYENASFYTRGALEWAETLYNKVIELDPNNPTPYLRIALINMARSNSETSQDEKKYYIEEALKKYDEALAKKNDLAAAYYGKAVAYEKLANNSDAIENLKRAVLISKDNLDYRFELGRLYFNRGIAQPALEQNATTQITEGSEQDALSVQGVNGGTMARNDDLNAAEQHFLSILSANPNHANTLYSLAILYQKVNEKDKAIERVQKLLEIVPDDVTKDVVRQQFKDIL